MKIEDHTPPSDLPDVVIMQDRERGFWVRVNVGPCGFHCPHDGYFQTLPRARIEARKLGYNAEAWVDEGGRVLRFSWSVSL